MKPGNPPEFLLWNCIEIYWLKCIRRFGRLATARVDYAKEQPDSSFIGQLLIYRHPTQANIQLRAYNLLARGVVLAVWGFKDDPDKSHVRAVFLQNEWYALDQEDELEFILRPTRKDTPINSLGIRVTEPEDNRITEIEIKAKN